MYGAFRFLGDYLKSSLSRAAAAFEHGRQAYILLFVATLLTVHVVLEMCMFSSFIATTTYVLNENLHSEVESIPKHMRT